MAKTRKKMITRSAELECLPLKRNIQLPKFTLASDPLIDNVPGLQSSHDSKCTNFSIAKFVYPKFSTYVASVIIVNVFPLYVAESA